MAAAVAGFSLYPLFIAAGGGATSPLWLNTGWRLGIILGCLAFFRLHCWREATDRSLLGHTAANLIPRPSGTPRPRTLQDTAVRWAMPLALLNGLGYALFAFSIRFLDVPVATVIFETWPIVMITLLVKLGQSQAPGPRTSLTPKDWLLTGLATAGMAMAIASQGGLDPTGSAAGPWHLFIGVATAVLAAGAAGTAAFSLIWSRAITASLPAPAARRLDPDRTGIYLALLPLFITSAVAVPAGAAASIATGETTAWHILLTGIAAGALTSTGASVLFLKANLLTRNPAINSLNYLTPVLALVSLFAAAQSGLTPPITLDKPEYLVAGAAMVTAANAAMHFSRAQKHTA